MSNGFVGIPNLPTENTSPALAATIRAITQNVNVLIGQRGRSGEGAAVLKGNITLTTLPALVTKGVTSQGGGFSISGVQVPSATDHEKLRQDVANLANDVVVLHRALQILINQLKS